MIIIFLLNLEMAQKYNIEEVLKEILNAFPGIADDENITTSSGLNFICL